MVTEAEEQAILLCGEKERRLEAELKETKAHERELCKRIYRALIDLGCELPKE